MIVWGEPPNEVEVPDAFVPWKKIVPPAPPVAEILVLPQNVPAPLTVTAAGVGFTIKVTSSLFPLHAVVLLLITLLKRYVPGAL